MSLSTIILFVCGCVWMLITRPRKFSQCENSTDHQQYTRNNFFCFRFAFSVDYFSVAMDSHGFMTILSCYLFFICYNDAISKSFRMVYLPFFTFFSLVCFKRLWGKKIILPHTPTPHLSHTVKFELTRERKKIHCLRMGLSLSQYLPHISPRHVLYTCHSIERLSWSFTNVPIGGGLWSCFECYFDLNEISTGFSINNYNLFK